MRPVTLLCPETRRHMMSPAAMKCSTWFHTPCSTRMPFHSSPTQGHKVGATGYPRTTLQSVPGSARIRAASLRQMQWVLLSDNSECVGRIKPHIHHEKRMRTACTALCTACECLTIVWRICQIQTMAGTRWPQRSTYNNRGLHCTSAPMAVVVTTGSDRRVFVRHEIRDWALQEKKDKEL